VGNRNVEATVLQNLGSLMYQGLNQNEKALEFLKQALPIMREVGNRYGEGMVLQNLGGVYRAFGQHKQALEYFMQSLVIMQEINHPLEMRNNYFLCGQANYNLGNNTDALDDFTHAIELQPNNWLHYNWRGTTYFATQDYPKALADLTRAIELQPENSENFYWRGRTYYELEDYSESFADFNRAVELQPDDADYSKWQSLVRKQLGKQ
jgi:tetratricopeptide (TPR) repeat protein